MVEKIVEVKNKNLETVRGIAAFSVIIGHLFVRLNINKNHLTALFSNWATEAVIVFFILSGIVIHSSFDKKPRTKIKFLVQRIVRLHPTLIISVFLTLIVEYLILKHKPSLTIIAGNLVPLSTLNGYLCDVFWDSNPVVWTLTFELFFYLFFALFIIQHQKLNTNRIYIWLGLSFICIRLYYMEFNILFLKHLIEMLAFSSIWIVGFLIWKLKAKISSNFIFALFSLLTLPLISRLKITDNFYDPFKYLLFAINSIPLFIFLLQSRLEKLSAKFNWVLCITVILIYVSSILLIWTEKSYLTIIKSLYISLPIFSLFFFIKPIKNVFVLILKKVVSPIFSYLGWLSYPLYLLHYPIMVFITHYFNLPIVIKIILIFGITFIISYVIEKYIQPFINRKILKKLVFQ